MTPDEIAALPYRRCVGVCLMNSDGRVFAGLRNDGPQDAWQMPQGGIDAGEAPRDAAIRELWEETGVTESLVDVVSETADWLSYDLPHDIVPRIWKGRFRGQTQKWFLMRFLGADSDVEIATDHPEFSAWRWLSAGEVLSSIVPFKRGVYGAVFAEFRQHLT